MTHYSIRRNRLKDKLARGERIFGALLDTPSPDIVEMLGLLGFDYLTLEGQHGAYDDSLYLSLIRAAEIYDMTAVVRVRASFRIRSAAYWTSGCRGCPLTWKQPTMRGRSFVRPNIHLKDGAGSGDFRAPTATGWWKKRRRSVMGMRRCI